ncbi:MAG: DUF2149 domain-containing protein [Solirubrobacteraceae bacterium]|nr:DUF2149 domain-containing protein [Patulibacter sp.]
MSREGRRSGRRRIGDAAGDPLDGLVNLFDVGVVLAVAFLIAGLTSSVNRQGKLESRQPTASTPSSREQPQRSQSQATPAKGKGRAVGTVYRLDDGRLVYTTKTTP